MLSAAEYAVKFLRIPPYHWELIAPELIWAKVKDYFARHSNVL